jgi:hypothetical protein
LVFDFPPGTAAAIAEKPPVELDVAARGATSGEGWSLSGDGESVQAEAKGKTKPKGKGRPVAPGEAAAHPAADPTPKTTAPSGTH